MIQGVTISNHDLIATGAAFLAVTLILFLFEYLQRKFEWPRTHVRKAIHVIVGLLICIASYVLESNLPILVLAFLFLFIDWWALKTHHFNSMHPNSYSLGTIFYPVSIFILAAIFWYTDKWIFITATLLMVVPDALAGIVGTALGNHFFILVREKKSLPGTLTMFVSSFLLVFIAASFRQDISMVQGLELSLVIGLIATSSELLSSRGSDNLSVPLISALFFHAFLADSSYAGINPLLIATVLSAMAAYLSYRMNFLNAGGAVAAFVMGSIILGFGGLMYTVPILVFFISSSILSRAGKGYKKQFESSFEKTGVRDFYQVWANGGIATLIVLFGWLFENPYTYIIYLVTMATANADTWATELGVFSRNNPRLITNFKAVGPGTSGAISVTGSIAAGAGALLIGLSGMIFIPNGIEAINIVNLLIIITMSGLSGCFIDSVFGATIQAQYICPVCRKTTEKTRHCSQNAELFRGLLWLNNDFVNIIAILLSGLISILIIYLIV